jgi:hypothetical protein
MYLGLRAGMSDAAPAARGNDNRIVVLLVLFTVASAIVFVEIADALAGLTRRAETAVIQIIHWLAPKQRARPK